MENTGSFSTQDSDSSIMKFECATFGTRFLAFLIDWLLLLFPSAVMNRGIPFVGIFVVFFMYYIPLEIGPAQGTIGKRVMKIRVVRKDGGTISIAQAVVRRLISWFSCALLCVGHFLALFTDKKQALHDIVADTYVVQGLTETPIPDAWIAGVRRLFGIR